jgi:S-methylmethionine-dependent homocysteine/selenocysteine methylase
MAHREAIVSGADVIASYTHATSVRVLSRGGFAMRAAAITHRAVDLALDEAARSERAVLVAATLGPLGVERDRIAVKTALEEHREQVARLVAASVDLLFVEAMPTLEETIAATAAAASADRPVWLVLHCKNATTLESGQELALALRLCAAAGAQLVILSAPSIESTLVALETAETCGSGMLFGVRIRTGPELSPERYAAALGSCIGRGARVVGGLGNVTPAHTRALVEFVRARRAA